MKNKLISLILVLALLLTSVLAGAEGETYAQTETEEAIEQIVPSENEDGSVAEENHETGEDADTVENEFFLPENDDEITGEADTVDKSEAEEEAAALEETSEEAKFEAEETDESGAEEAAETQIDYTKSCKYSPEFSRGYVEISQGAAMYNGYNDAEPFATAKKGYAYAVKRVNAGKSNDKLEIAYFDADGVHSAYVSASNATPLSPNAVQKLTAELGKLPDSKQYYQDDKKTVQLSELNVSYIETRDETVESEQNETENETDSGETLEEPSDEGNDALDENVNNEAETDLSPASQDVEGEQPKNDGIENEPDSEAYTEASDEVKAGGEDELAAETEETNELTGESADESNDTETAAQEASDLDSETADEAVEPLAETETHDNNENENFKTGDEAKTDSQDETTEPAQDITAEENKEEENSENEEDDNNESEAEGGLSENETEELFVSELPVMMMSVRAMSASAVGATSDVVFDNLENLIALGDTLAVSAHGVDESGNITGEEITYTVSGAAASIDGNKITALTQGVFKLTATAASGVSKTVEMTVTNPPTVIKLGKTSDTVGINGTLAISYSVNDGSAASVTWTSSDNDVAKVSANGVVTGVSSGTAVITATTYNGITASCAISVLSEPDDLKLSVSEVTISENETIKIDAAFTGDVFGNVYCEEIVGDGEVELTPIGAGSFSVKGVYSGRVSALFYVYNKTTDQTYFARLNITILPAVAKIEIQNERTAIGYKETVDLKPIAYDARGNVVNEAITLSTSNKSYVSVNGSKIYGAYMGTATITAKTENGVSASISVKTVKAPTSITLNEKTARLSVGESLDLTAALSSGSASAITWTSSDANVASVDQNGHIIAVGGGSANITAATYVSGKTAVCTVTVTSAPTGVSFAKSEYTVLEGMSLDTALVFTPSGAEGAAVYETGDKLVATIDETGKITGVNSGSCEITVTVTSSVTGEEFSAKATVNVKPAPTFIELATDRTVIGKGETIKLSPVAYDKYGDKVDTTFTITSSKTSYVRVNGEEIVGAGTGTADITIQAANGASKKISVKVVSAPTKLTLSATSLTLSQGQSEALTYKLNSTSTASAITWTSDNESVASVEDGVIVAKSAGTAKIRCQTYLSKVYGECTVTVGGAPTAISFADTSLAVKEGETAIPTVELLPSSALKNIEYELEFANGEKTVELNGSAVKALYSGSAVLTAKVFNYETNEYLTASCDITVQPGVSSIAFRSDRSTVGLKETVDLKPVAYDARGNEIDANIRLSIKGSYLKLVEGSLVYGNSRGSATVTATAENGVSANKKITVSAAPSSVKISAESTSAAVGEKISLKAITTGSDTADVTWTSGDESVFTVDANGKATAISLGNAVITATTYNGKTATITLNAVHAPSSIRFASAAYSVGEGGSVKTVLTIEPDGSAASPAYRISDGEIASVDASGTVYGKVSGKTTLVAEVINHETGETVSAETEITVTTAPSSIAINGRTTIGVGETVDLKPVAYDGRGNEISTTFTLTSSSKNYVKPTSGTLVKGQSKGNATLTVLAANGFSVTVKVTVATAPSAVKLDISQLKLQAGDEYTLNPYFANGQAGAISYKSSDEGVARVDSDGKVTALKGGNAVITVSSYNNKTAKVNVSVSASPTAITYAEDELRVVMGSSAQLSEAFTPIGSWAKAEYSSSDASVVSVDENGKISAKKVGNAVISVKAYSNALGEEISASVNVEVCMYPAFVEAGADSVTLGVGETLTLNPKAFDAQGNEIGTEFTISTSNKSYVSVNGDTIKGAKAGSAKITVSVPGGSSKVINVTVMTAPSSVKLTNALTMAVGEQYKLEPVFNAKQYGSVTWTSSDESVAKVDENGTVTALKKGTVKIQVKTFNNKTAATTITVCDAPTGISFGLEKYTLSENASVQTSVSLEPAGSYAVVAYEIVDEAMATVDEKGAVKGIAAGTTTLTATVANAQTGESYLASSQIEVTPAAVSIAVNQTRTKIGVGETIDLMPVAYDSKGNVVETTFTLKSSSVYQLTVSGTKVKGIKASKPTVTITSANGISIKVNITVAAAPSKIAITAPSAYVGVNNTIALKAEPNNVADAEVTWSSSDESVATVNEAGLVTGKKVGSVTITATTYNGKKAAYSLSVLPEANAISFANNKVSVGLGGSVTVQAVLPEGTASNVIYASTNPYIASVDATTGRLSGNRTGSAKIVATIKNVTEGKYYTASYTVTVTPVPARIELSTDRRTVGVGEKLALEPLAFDANGEPTGGSFSYASSKSSYISVSEDGVITAKKSGSATITITSYNGVKLSVAFKVVSAPTAIKLSAANTNVVVDGESAVVNATLTPKAAVGEITWTSEDESIATVDAAGRITGVNYGTVRIKATTYNGKSAFISVNVFNKPEEIKLSADSISLGVGQNQTLTYSFPEGQYSEISFESNNEAVAKVDQNGKISAVGQGSAVVTAKAAGGVSASCEVNVKPAPASVSFSESSITVGIGQELNAGDYIVFPDGTQASVTFTVESSKVLENKGDGLVRGKAAGTTRIKATTHNGKTAYLTVKVVKAATSFSVSKSQDVVYEGDIFMLSPVFPNNTTASVTYTSSDEAVLTVESDGSAKAHGAGTSEVVATSHNGVKVKLSVTVYRHVEGVTLDISEISLVHYDTAQLAATVSPEGVYDSGVIWTSSDPEKVSVSETGLMTALSVTEAPVTVTATTNDGAFTASCTVSVTPVRVSDIELSKSELKLEKGRSANISVSIMPTNADNKAVSWTSSNIDVATVDAEGNITAVSNNGTAIISCVSLDGNITKTVSVTAEKVHLVSAELDESEINAEHNTEKDLTYTVYPADADLSGAIWTVSDPAVISVNQNGHLKALSIGEAVVTLKLVDTFGGEYSCSANVKVEPVKVTSVEISDSEIHLRVGRTGTVSVNVYPLNADNRNVTWTTLDKNVATIEQLESGALVLAGAKAGETKIVATSVDGGYTAECVVKVFEAIELNAAPNFTHNTAGNDIVWKLGIENSIGDVSYTINVTKDGSSVYASQSYDIDMGIVFASATVGEYKLSVTITDGEGDSASTESTVTVSDAFTLTQNNIVWEYVIVDAQGDKGAAVRLVSCPSGTKTITVPETMNGAKVVRIDTEAFLNRTELTKVNIPASVTEIGARAFKGCTALTSLETY